MIVLFAMQMSTNVKSGTNATMIVRIPSDRKEKSFKISLHPILPLGMCVLAERIILWNQIIDANTSRVTRLCSAEMGNTLLFCLGDEMKMFVAVANKIYEIDRLRDMRIIYTGPENMTIRAVDYHYRNQLLYFTDPYAHKVRARQSRPQD